MENTLLDTLSANPLCGAASPAENELIGNAATTAGRLATRRRLPASADLLFGHSRASEDRRKLEEFIRSEFLDHFSAEITEFMPSLVGLYGAEDSVLAAVGCRSAHDERLFLETYMDQPVETVMSRKLGVAVGREEIVEVGSLAARNGRAAMFIVQALVPYLLEAGFSWVVFTGTKTVVSVFERLRLRPHPLCTADKSRLTEDQQRAWGNYYDHQPVVMAGRLFDGITALSAAAHCDE